MLRYGNAVEKRHNGRLFCRSAGRAFHYERRVVDVDACGNALRADMHHRIKAANTFRQTIYYAPDSGYRQLG